MVHDRIVLRIRKKSLYRIDFDNNSDDDDDDGGGGDGGMRHNTIALFFFSVFWKITYLLALIGLIR